MVGDSLVPINNQFNYNNATNMEPGIAKPDNKNAIIPKDSYDFAGGVAEAERKDSDSTDALKRRFDNFECQTCASRRYKDGSNDPGVSFKTPGKIDPGASAAVVKGHENEHVSRNQAKAQREGKEIVSQSVSLSTDICPECNKSFVSGGQTRTVTASKGDSKAELYNVGTENAEEVKGQNLDTVA